MSQRSGAPQPVTGILYQMTSDYFLALIAEAVAEIFAVLGVAGMRTVFNNCCLRMPLLQQRHNYPTLHSEVSSKDWTKI
jgi:hypothetical protein